MTQETAKHRAGRFFFIGFFLIFCIILADQATKWMMLESVLPEKAQSLDFATWFFTRHHIEYFADKQEQFKTITVSPMLNYIMVWNHGVSFGLFDSTNPKTSLIFIAIALMVSMMLVTWMVFARRRMLVLGLAFVSGGAIANAIDRVRFGAVADFIDVHLQDKHWPAFNVADSFVVLGAGLLILDVLLSKGKGPMEA
ncbi:MAG: signal peptidase II [Alphaproteobacteria bacterium]|nr:signal peptidase II [Alphaproteobacteria bacterium]